MDGPLLRVLEHVLEELDRRYGEGQVVALAVAHLVGGASRGECSHGESLAMVRV